MTTQRKIVLILVLVSAAVAHADEVFVTRFGVRTILPPCHQRNWSGDALLMNQTPSPVQIRLLGVSNGAVPAGQPTSFTLLPSEIVALTARIGWIPGGLLGADTFLFVTRLDVPAGVLIDNVDVFVDSNECILPVNSDVLARVSLPVFLKLTAANEAQVKFGTDLGGVQSHQNVAIYNGGDVTASAHIQILRPCDNALMAERFVSVEPDTMIQVNGLPLGDNACTSSFSPSFARITVVTVDQPSFSIVSTIAEQTSPSSAGPRVQLGVK